MVSGSIIKVVYDGTNFQLFSPDQRAVAGGNATLDSNSRLVQAANTVWDGTAGRSASPTAGADIIPVAGGSGQLATGFMNTAPAVTDGTNTIKIKTINIGDWDMDATDNISVPHGLTFANIRRVEVSIRYDAESDKLYNLQDGQADGPAGGSLVDGANVYLYRVVGKSFDGVAFNSTSYNRGWIMITYVE